MEGFEGTGGHPGGGEESEVSATASPFDSDIEGALRPRHLDEFIQKMKGQRLHLDTIV